MAIHAGVEGVGGKGEEGEDDDDCLDSGLTSMAIHAGVEGVRGDDEDNDDDCLDSREDKSFERKVKTIPDPLPTSTQRVGRTLDSNPLSASKASIRRKESSAGS